MYIQLPTEYIHRDVSYLPQNLPALNQTYSLDHPVYFKATFSLQSHLCSRSFVVFASYSVKKKFLVVENVMYCLHSDPVHLCLIFSSLSFTWYLLIYLFTLPGIHQVYIDSVSETTKPETALVF